MVCRQKYILTKVFKRYREVAGMGNMHGEKYNVRIRLAEILAVCLFLLTLVDVGQEMEMQNGGGGGKI